MILSPLAAPRGSNTPDQCGTRRYMPGHGSMAVCIQVHAWQGREPMPGGAPGWGPRLAGHHQAAPWLPLVAPTPLTNASDRDACLAMVPEQSASTVP